LVEIIGKMELAEADFEKKNPHLKYNPPGWERFQKYLNHIDLLRMYHL
jgi:hypothetical protein